MIIRINSCSTFAHRINFGGFFRNYYGRESGLEMRPSFDIKKHVPYYLQGCFAQMCTEESNPSEVEDGLDFCALSVYLQAKKIRKPPIVHQRLNWVMPISWLMKEVE